MNTGCTWGGDGKAFHGGVPGLGRRHSSIAKKAPASMRVTPSKSTALRRCRARSANRMASLPGCMMNGIDVRPVHVLRAQPIRAPLPYRIAHTLAQAPDVGQR